MHIGTQQNPAFGQRRHIDVRIHTALTDDLQLGQARNQRRTYRCALADQHQRLGVLQALGKHILVFGVIVPDGYVMVGHQFVRVEFAYHVLVIV